MDRENTIFEFTEDMADTLHQHFHAYARDGRVTLELRGGGVWLIHPVAGKPQFLGAARPLQLHRSPPH